MSSLYYYYLWTDGTDVYYSSGTTQKVLDKANSRWINKTWSGVASANFYGQQIFSDGNSTYLSFYDTTGEMASTYTLNKTTSQ